MGGIIPGLILSSLFILYIAIRCFIQPEMGPPLPLEERVSLKEKMTAQRSNFPY
jgi:TRAP-type mannitol/chloroaromatic compound transport system permease large subunit